MSVEKKDFGKLSDGRQVHLYTIVNANGMSVSLTEFGASIVSIVVRDRQGNWRDVVLGCDNAAAYEKQTASLGSVPGRHANRIEKGCFTLNGQQYQLAINDGPNHLHGGPTGFQRRLWNGEIAGKNGVVFTRLSPDGEEGYPGNLVAAVHYILEDNNQLRICYHAISDKDTVINLTNHAYFNLNGHQSGSALGQYLQIFADQFTENDAGCLPTGRKVSLDSDEGKPMDFRQMHMIGEFINEENQHLKNGSGYDHNYVLRKDAEGLCARAYSEQSGILMECHTTQPGLQLYTANFLEGSHIDGKEGAIYHNRDAFCLETQHFPNAMEHADFPSVVLKAGQVYQEETGYIFKTI